MNRDEPTAKSKGVASDQSRVIAFLQRPQSYADEVQHVDVVETHAALVFLAGSQVHKIKKAVTYSYLDFSTLELRRRACEREIEINKPHAPGIYLGLVAITASDAGTLSIGGSGTPAFIIGDELVPGAIIDRQMTQLIAQARNGCQTC